ncbi:MAG: hypothetical protein MJ075_05685, partial [Oscillospiraceae bacterium]|nr:hypothetical protein [Oscillospiraceae bacterium]
MSNTNLTSTMSASQKREQAKLEEKKRTKKTMRITIIVILVCALLLAAALTINSNFMRRQGKAFSVNGMDFSAAEFNFHFYNYYYEYVQYVYTEVPDYAGMLLPNSSTTMEAQQYSEGVTWKDHFMEYTESCLKEDTALYKAGKAEGFEMSADQMQAYEDEIEGLATQASTYGYSSVDKLIQKTYGASVTEEILKEQLLFVYYAQAYEEHCKSAIQFTDAEIQQRYEEKKDMYDLFDYRYFIVYPEAVDEEQYKDDEEGLAAAKEAALADAHDRAAAIAAGIKTPEDFAAAAKEYDPEKYSEEGSVKRSYNGELLGGTYGPWLRDAARKSGDVEIFDISVGVY